MAKNKPFTTKNNLVFNTLETPLQGFAFFALGTVTGMFSENDLVIDVVPDRIIDPEHLTDLVEWFAEGGRISNKMVRVSGPLLPSIEARLLTDFKFYKTSKGTIVRGEWVLGTIRPQTRKELRKNEQIQNRKSNRRR